MSNWRAGPLAFDLGSCAPPPDWFVDDSVADVTIAVDPRAIAQTGAGAVRVTDHGDHARMFRERAWDARVDYKTGTATYQGGIDIDGLSPCPLVESFLRVLSSDLLLRRGGALLHASSVAVDGRAYVFCGLSGAGKTTLVEGTADGVYLSDDQSIVSVDERGDFLAWGTPFSGLAARRAPPVSTPVAAVVLLASVRPSFTTLTRVPATATRVGELLRHVCAYDRSAAGARRALGVVQQLTQRVPLFTLERHISTSLSEILLRIDGASAARADASVTHSRPASATPGAPSRLP